MKKKYIVIGAIVFGLWFLLHRAKNATHGFTAPVGN
jgi:hypothetical protein